MMTPELEHALKELELVESMGVHIPAKSRAAIFTAIMHGCYDATVDGIKIEIGDRELDTVIAEGLEEDLKPVFGL